jgi:siroheme synthase-like protein
MAAKRVLPVALMLEGRDCLVIGSADEAASRAQSLVDAGARVWVVGKSPGKALDELARRREIVLLRRAFLSRDLADKWLVVIADRDAKLALRVAKAAEARRVHYCAVDHPTRGSFSHMALARSGALVIAISTGGVAPALSRRLREELECLLERSGVERYVSELGVLRERTEPTERRQVLGRAVKGVRLEGSLAVPRASLENGRSERVRSRFGRSTRRRIRRKHRN